MDSLELEMEVQDVADRVTILEQDHAHIIDMQKSIIRNQEQIFSRLAALKDVVYQLSHNRHHYYIPPPPTHAPPTLDSSLEYSFDEFGIEPPSHAPLSPHLYDLPPSSNHSNTPYIPPPSQSPPRHRAFGVENSDTGPIEQDQTNLQPPRNPFRPLQPTSNQHTAPSKRKTLAVPLPSSAIKKSELLQPTTVFQKYPNLLCESKLGTLAVKLAREAFFGDQVLMKCTVAGERDYPALPTEELRQLKHALYMHFPQYWQTPQEFEVLWKKCTENIGQACKRLRRK